MAYREERSVEFDKLADIAKLCPLNAKWGTTKLMSPELEQVIVQLRRDLDSLQGAMMSDLMVPDETMLERMRRVHHAFGSVLAEAAKK